MKLVQVFDKPISGNWDGGKKDVFRWGIDGYPQKDSKGSYAKIGSFGANHWFHVAMGKTEKQTLANARRRLSYLAKRKNMVCTFCYEED